MKKIIIEVTGGMVSAIQANKDAEDLEVLVIDWDCNNDEGTIGKDEVLEFEGGEKFKNIDFGYEFCQDTF